MASTPMEFPEVSLDDKQILAEWLASDEWDNFSNPKITTEGALRWIERGGFHGDDKRTFWIQLEMQNKVGLIQLYDLLDSTAMFDIRIRTSHRGMASDGRH